MPSARPPAMWAMMPGAAPRRVTPRRGQTLSRMIEVAEATGESVISLVPVEGPEISNYGCAWLQRAPGRRHHGRPACRKPPLRTLRRIFGSRAGMSSRPTSSKTRAHCAGEEWRDPADRRHGDADRRPWDARPVRRRRGFDAGRKPTASGPMSSFRYEVMMALTSPPCCVLLWSRTASSLTG